MTCPSCAIGIAEIITCRSEALAVGLGAGVGAVGVGRMGKVGTNGPMIGGKLKGGVNVGENAALPNCEMKGLDTADANGLDTALLELLKLAVGDDAEAMLLLEKLDEKAMTAPCSQMTRGAKRLCSQRANPYRATPR
jgi:hypothetical protein